MATATQTTDTQATLAKLQQYPPLIDLGKVKVKHAKKLRKGKLGPLDHEIAQSFQQVQAGIEGNNRPIIFSYEQKRSKKVKNKIDLLGVTVDRKKAKKQLKKNGIRTPFL